MGVFHFDFERDVPLASAELSLHLAMFAVEGLVGRARVQLGIEYTLDLDRHSIAITGDAVAKTAARVFTGLLLREFGEAAFSASYVAGCDDRRQCAAV
jgi:hypothetical protein